MPRPDHTGVVNTIYRTAAQPELWRQTLVGLADYVGAIGGLLAYAAPAGKSNNLLVVGRLRDDLTDLYLRHYAQNPYARALAHAPTGRVLTTHRLVDASVIRRTAFHADILAPQAIMDEVLFTHAGLTRDGAAGGIGFPLGQRQADEIGEAAGRLDRLIPHLTRALDFTFALGRHQSGAWQVAQILDAMPGAAVLLDRTAGILRMNATAEALLQEADGLALIEADGWRLEAHARDEARKLARAIAQALSVARGEDSGLVGALRITRPSGRAPLIVLVTPLPPASFALFEALDGGARALVQIVDAHAPAFAQAELLREAAGLTAMEARVAALIGAGLSAPAAAATLGISVNTAKTHLVRCFDKTGVHSQAALARLLASMPTGKA